MAGLAGVVLGETRLSDVRGAEGALEIAGLSVRELTATHTITQAAERLWGRPVDLGRGRVRAFDLLAPALARLDHDDGMDALRAGLAQLPAVDDDTLAGAVPVVFAAWTRVRAGRSPIAPDPSRSHAADTLRMLGVHDSAAGALDAYLVTVCEHGLNASTFAARVVTGTRSDAVSSVVAAVGALKGPLHGGAPGPVLDMLDAVAAPERALTWLQEELDAGRRIMGMGHRVYRARDPRAAVLEEALQRLPNPHAPRLALAKRVEREAERLLAERHPERPLRANVEFYTAVLLEAVGLDRAWFTPMFAVGRVFGWIAHIHEQRASGVMIRPRLRYVRSQPNTMP